MDVATPTVAEKGHPLPLRRQVRMEGYKRSLQWKSAMATESHMIMLQSRSTRPVRGGGRA